METQQKLPVELKQRWVAALRSGEYKQGNEALVTCEVDDNGRMKEGSQTYCCLGVLCHLEGISDNSMEAKAFPSDLLEARGRIPSMLMDHSDEYKSWEVQTHPTFVLANLNDEAEYSFEQIADYIEKNY